jgi:hypothetical protein
MAVLRFIEDYKSVSALVNDLRKSTGNVFILASKKIFDEQGLDMKIAESVAEHYTCGGEPDIQLDIVTKSNDYFVQVFDQARAEW